MVISLTTKLLFSSQQNREKNSNAHCHRSKKCDLDLGYSFIFKFNREREKNIFKWIKLHTFKADEIESRHMYNSEGFDGCEQISQCTTVNGRLTESEINDTKF